MKVLKTEKDDMGREFQISLTRKEAEFLSSILNRSQVLGYNWFERVEAENLSIAIERALEEE